MTLTHQLVNIDPAGKLVNEKDDPDPFAQSINTKLEEGDLKKLFTLLVFLTQKISCLRLIEVTQPTNLDKKSIQLHTNSHTKTYNTRKSTFSYCHMSGYETSSMS